MNFTNLKLNKIGDLPKSAGVYCFRSGNKILYIGKATNLRSRVKQHKMLIEKADCVGYIETASETEALLLEAKLIKKYQPKYNIAWKDDKNYFYIGITREEFPRVFITHQPKPKTENRKLKINYIGPFVNGKTLKQALKELRKRSPYRTCKILSLSKKDDRPCLWYYLGQCQAPCLFADFFRAKHIEAYDISNIQGKEAAGSMVTFINGKPDKNFYRRFKIRFSDKPNDTAMIKEVLSRRFKHLEWPYPDLILIDGGKAQLNAALKVKRRKSKIKNIKIISLAKKENKLYIEGRQNPLFLENLPREIFNLLLQLRDEAHRFAISYHHKLRTKFLIPK